MLSGYSPPSQAAAAVAWSWCWSCCLAPLHQRASTRSPAPRTRARVLATVLRVEGRESREERVEAPASSSWQGGRCNKRSTNLGTLIEPEDGEGWEWVDVEQRI